MARVDENPSEAAQAWRSAARTWVERRARVPGEFNGDDLRAVVGSPPHHPNAMGPIWSWAVKQGLVRLVGYRQRRAASANAQKIAVYTGAAFAPQREGEKS